MLILKDAAMEHLQLLRRWDAAAHIVAAKGTEDWEWERELARSPNWREQLIAYVDEKPIGFIQIIDPALEDSHYWGNCSDNLRAIDIWIGEEDYIGRGFGTRMMRMAIDRCFAVPSVEAILIDPLATNTRARRFYERFGFQFVEIRRFEDDVCAVYRLNREGSV